MKSMKLCPKKADKIILKGLKLCKSSDEIYKDVVSSLGLYGVAFFGHGSKYQKLKCSHIWNSILFFQYDFKEFEHLTTKEQKLEIKKFLQIT